MGSLRIICADQGREHSTKSWVSFSVDSLTAYGTLGNFINFSGSHHPHLQSEGVESDYLCGPFAVKYFYDAKSFQLMQKEPLKLHSVL